MFNFYEHFVGLLDPTHNTFCIIVSFSSDKCIITSKLRIEGFATIVKFLFLYMKLI